MDVGYVESPIQSEANGTPHGEEGQGRYWLLWASTGIDGFVVSQIEPRPRWFKYLGPAGYFARALAFLPQFEGMRSTVSVDNQTLEGEYLLINVSNCRMWLGGELKLNQEAVLDDGFFELWLFRGKHWPRLLSYGLEVTREEHVKNPDVTVLRCQQVRVHTEPPMSYHLDGEPLAETPFAVTLRHGALLLLAPDSTPSDLFTLPGQPLQPTP
jgi:diacylglycerol kinase (ATP)